METFDIKERKIKYKLLFKLQTNTVYHESLKFNRSNRLFQYTRNKHLILVLSVLRLTDYDYRFGIFKLFFYFNLPKM